jgi:asparagine synthase (glutamine-hydrolysing)
MCGIAGVVDFRERVDEAPVRAMCRAMHHRGPDDEGIFLSAVGECALGNRRLAIIDLSASGHMPMESVDGRYWITYNGELYDFGELRAGLERRGRRFGPTRTRKWCSPSMRNLVPRACSG